MISNSPRTPTALLDEPVHRLARGRSSAYGSSTSPCNASLAHPQRSFRKYLAHDYGLVLKESPEETALALFRRLQIKHPGTFPDNQLRTLQRRVCQWRAQKARQLVFGVDSTATVSGLTSLTADLITVLRHESPNFH